jgi:DNA invertase Pin-like site-specific DNA recombinase
LTLIFSFGIINPCNGAKTYGQNYREVFGMIYGYARVSTRRQSEAGNSLEEQTNQLKREGCEIIVQEQCTGTKMSRPKFDELIHKLQEGDKLIVTKLDRFARNVTEGIEVVRHLFSKGVKVHVLNVGLLENTAIGNFFLTTLLAVAELERSMIIERTQAGKEIARTKAGFKDGRPKKYKEFQLKSALELLNEHSYNDVEKLTGISKSTLIREKRIRDSKGQTS